MNAAEALDYLNTYGWSRFKLGLERTEELLQRLGNPEKGLKFVHVAGTNGKGSVCAMLDSIFRNAGYKTGLYISPYIEDFRERIQVNGEYISEEALGRLTALVRGAADSMEDHPSHFELITALGMLYFKETACDIVILEVGMGGEMDSTNVIDPPEAAIITNIGLDHTEYLGDTVEKIAKTKAGIIKTGSAAVLYRSAPEVMEALESDCDKKGVPYYVAGMCRSVSHGLNGQEFEYEGERYELNLLGRHQLKNAAVVLKAAEVLREKGWRISGAAVKKGLKEVTWPARFEVLCEDPLFVLDGGHNPQCAEALAQSLQDYIVNDENGRKVTFLIGMLADKDYETVLRIIKPYGGCYVCITPDSPRALKGRELAGVIDRIYQEDGAMIPIACKDSIKDGITAALESGLPVVAFGSLYSAGAVRRGFRDLKADSYGRFI